MITQKRLQEAFDYRDNNLVWWQPAKNSTKKPGDLAGYVEKDGYRRIRIDNRTYYAHILIWVYHFGDIPEGFVVDHRDTNRENNAITNLRLATLSQNQYNRLKSEGKSSKYKGVSWHTTYGKWRASIEADGKMYHIGYFSSEIEAHEAYCEVATEIFGEFFNDGRTYNAAKQ